MHSVGALHSVSGLASWPEGAVSFMRGEGALRRVFLFYLPFIYTET